MLKEIESPIYISGLLATSKTDLVSFNLLVLDPQKVQARRGLFPSICAEYICWPGER